ncbi:MAG: hypothetical protein AUG49_05110 [Catenulispora sp. 13_1_20CM_3_70_7]|nr:MAG: hypothetical protein AUG49_05110 [Catenulispora sp. 13_1_20CM_3_70_7]
MFEWISGRAVLAESAAALDAVPLRYAQAAAVEAVAMLIEARGTSVDLWFADLLDAHGLEEFAPGRTMLLPLIAHVRGQLAGHEPYLRLPPGTPIPTAALLLIAAQAIRAAADDEPERQALLAQCLNRAAADRPGAPALKGTLVPGLSAKDQRTATEAELDRDTFAGFVSGRVPVPGVGMVTDDGPAVLLGLALAARPDIADLLWMLTTDPPTGGADVGVAWTAMAMHDKRLVRADITFLNPVHTEFGVIFDVDDNKAAVRAIAGCSELALVEHAAAGTGTNGFVNVRIPWVGPACAVPEAGLGAPPGFGSSTGRCNGAGPAAAAPAKARSASAECERFLDDDRAVVCFSVGDGLGAVKQYESRRRPCAGRFARLRDADAVRHARRG